MQSGERHQVSRIIMVVVMVAILLIIIVPGARADMQHQTVPTMPPPTKSPTVTPPITATNPPGNTPTNSPANTATNPALPSATFAEATSLPSTQTAEAVASETAESAGSPSAAPSVTALVETASPTLNPSMTAVAGGNTVPQVAASEVPGETPLDAAASGGEASGMRYVWLFGLILAGAVLMLAVLLVRWVQARIREQNGGKGN